MTNPGMILFLLIAGHFLADYPLQGDYLSKAKNPNLPEGKGIWPICLAAHSFIHGGVVALVTGSVVLGLLETLVHSMIDYCKCKGAFDYKQDQFLHILFKVLWFAAMMSSLAIGRSLL